MRSRTPITLPKGEEAETQLYALNNNEIGEQASKPDCRSVTCMLKADESAKYIILLLNNFIV